MTCLPVFGRTARSVLLPDVVNIIAVLVKVEVGVSFQGQLLTFLNMLLDSDNE